MTELTKQLVSARERGYAIPAINVDNLETVEAVVTAAEMDASPMMISVSPNTMAYTKMALLSAVIRKAIENAKVPVFFHLDHGLSIEQAEEAMSEGCMSVMIDGTRLPLEENIKLTRRVCELAHRRGVIVEGALGHTGSSKVGDECQRTNPEEIEKFQKESEIDILSIEVGNVHGLPMEPLVIDFGLIARCSSRSSAFLTLHGGSFTPNEMLRKAIRAGRIVKINIGTEVRASFLRGIGTALPPDLSLEALARERFHGIMAAGRDTVVAKVREKIEVLGSKGMAERRTSSSVSTFPTLDGVRGRLSKS